MIVKERETFGVKHIPSCDAHVIKGPLKYRSTDVFVCHVLFCVSGVTFSLSLFVCVWCIVVKLPCRGVSLHVQRARMCVNGVMGPCWKDDPDEATTDKNEELQMTDTEHSCRHILDTHRNTVLQPTLASFWMILGVHWDIILSLYSLFSLESANLSSVDKTNDYLFIFYFQLCKLGWGLMDRVSHLFFN